MNDPAPQPDLDSESVELISRYARGDDSALGRLIDKHGPEVKQYIGRKLPRDVQRRVDASDIVQQMSMELFRIRERFQNQGPGAFRAMLRTMSDYLLQRAVEKERTQKRSTRREQRLDRATETAAGDPFDRIPGNDATPSGIVSRAEHRAQLVDAFARLPEADREIIDAIDYRGLSYPEAAEKIGASEETLRKRHSRAIQKLRDLMRGRE
ncbi:MAG: sigma-70 family RNA polymerase sigma factor [Planctomycetes bacterium]|nr:sigma-70 family RNA polymerase sigma factor [Planctomycetota bacterium]